MEKSRKKLERTWLKWVGRMNKSANYLVMTSSSKLSGAIFGVAIIVGSFNRNLTEFLCKEATFQHSNTHVFNAVERKYEKLFSYL